MIGYLIVKIVLFFSILFQIKELLLLCSGQSEPGSAMGLGQTQPQYSAGPHVLPPQLQTVSE